MISKKYNFLTIPLVLPMATIEIKTVHLNLLIADSISG